MSKFSCRSLLASEALQSYDTARIFLDEDFTAVDKFTVITCIHKYIRLEIYSVNIYITFVWNLFNK